MKNNIYLETKEVTFRDNLWYLSLITTTNQVFYISIIGQFHKQLISKSNCHVVVLLLWNDDIFVKGKVRK